jgi:hypothetical protein
MGTTQKAVTEASATATTVTALAALTSSATTAAIALQSVASSNSTGGGMFSFLPFHLATGGKVNGFGTDTSDNIPSLLSPGEYVVRAAAVRKIGTKFLDLLNYGGLPSLPKRYANGGLVTSTSSSSNNSGNNNAPSVKIEVVNQTNQNVEVSQGEATFDGETYVIKMFIQGVSHNTLGVRSLVRG